MLNVTSLGEVGNGAVIIALRRHVPSGAVLSSAGVSDTLFALPFGLTVIVALKLGMVVGYFCRHCTISPFLSASAPLRLRARFGGDGGVLIRFGPGRALVLSEPRSEPEPSSIVTTSSDVFSSPCGA